MFLLYGKLPVVILVMLLILVGMMASFMSVLLKISTLNKKHKNNRL